MMLGITANLVPIATTWLATYLVHSTLIFGAVWLLQWRAGARLRDLLWKASLVLPLVTTTARMSSPTMSATAPTWTLPRLELAALEAPQAPAATDSSATRDWVVAAPAISQPAVPSTVAAPALHPGSAPPRDRANPSSRALAWGGALLLLLGLVRLAVPLVRTERRLRGRRLIDSGPIHDEAQRLSTNALLKRKVAVYSLDGISSPIAAGTRHPAIYLPVRVTELPPSMLRSLLAHEIAHHVRFDPLWNRVAYAVVAVMYFQPLHRIARARLASSAELLADDQALRWTDDTEGLATCLAEVAGWIRPDRSHALGVPMVRARSQSALRERIERAFERPREASAPLRWPLTLGLAATTMALMPSLAGTPLAPSAKEASVLVDAAPCNPYEQALAPTLSTLERLGQELEDLPKSGPETDSLRSRWTSLHREAEALRASVITPNGPE